MSENLFRQETEAKTVNGWIALLIVSALLGFGGVFLYGALPRFGLPPLTTGILLIGVGLLCLRGFFTLQPNEAAVMLFFGSYAGTARSSGFHWVNPFYLKRSLSLRSHNLTTPVLKVNDERGSPIEIAAVVVWRVQDTARAAFEVQDYAEYIRIQCESALREVASRHAYDNAEEMLVPARYKTLRGDLEKIAEVLRQTIQNHINVAGIAVDEAKIPEAVRALTAEFMTLQGHGDRARAAELLGRLGVVRPEVQRVLDRLARVPVDIEPRYVAAERLLSGSR